MFCIFDTRIQEQLPAPAQRAVGGVGGLESGFAGIFLGTGGVAAARIGWIEVGLLSVRFAGVSRGVLVQVRSWIVGAVRALVLPSRLRS